LAPNNLPTVAVVGSANIDFVIGVRRSPAVGETILVGAYSEAVGGKGLNQAVAAAKIGPTFLIAAVGSDWFGTEIEQYASARGVDVTELAQGAGPTGRAFITVGPDGENSIMVAPLANRALTASHVVDALERNAPTAVLAQLEIPLDAVEAAANWCTRTDARFVLNPSPMAALPDDLIARCDPLIVNLGEARELARRVLPESSPESLPAEQLARALANHCRSVVLTVGADGAFYATPDNSVHVSAPMVEVCDTTGAGDEFAGVLAALAAAGSPLPEAAARAVAAASAVVALPRSRRHQPAQS
jgi:ribokinase